ncbi:MAG: CopG family transcriptional regulator [Actinomycetes bacterium]
MRTTLALNDQLFRELKTAAAARGCSMTSIIEDALRVALNQPQAPLVLPPLPVSRSTGGVVAGVDIMDSTSVRAALDSDRPLDAVR